MTSSETNRWSMGDEYRHQMTSLPVPFDAVRAQSTMPTLSPLPQEVYCCGEEGQRPIILLVAMPQPSCVERTTMPLERSVGVSVSHVAEDLTTGPTRCSCSELQTNEEQLLRRERTLRNDDKTLHETPGRLSTPSNPVFGKSKSPKSYWLRRHSDSVFAGGDRDLAQRDDDFELSVKDVSRPGKERTVSDSQSMLREFDVGPSSALPDNRKPLICRFQSTVVGMQSSGESDEVFDDSPAVQSTYTGQQHSEQPTTTHPQLEQSSFHRRRSRLTVVSAGNLEDIDEEHHAVCLNEYENDGRRGDGVVGSWTLAKQEVVDVSDQSLNDGVRSMELSAYPSLHEATRRDAEDRKLNGERELARPEAASSRGTICRRVSRVARSSRPSARAEPTSRSDSTSNGGGGKVHRCAVCRRTFSRSDMLERHARLHTGVRPYACRLCTQVFSRSDHLTTHLRTHTGEKPYACPRCSYTASRRDMVTRHLRVHQSTSAVDSVPPVSGVVGPSRRRIYRSRYKERSSRPDSQRPDVDDIGVATSFTSPPEPASALLDEGTSYVRAGLDEQRLSGVALTWHQPRDTPVISLSSPSPPTSETAPRRRLDHFPVLHALPRSIVARGSTGSTDSYSSPGSLSAGDVFEFTLSGVDGSPDVFRSPSSARQSTMFLFPYTATSTALSVCDQTDSL